MTISAKMIAHSTTLWGKQIWTVLARYPRFIHAEELTHRVLSSTPDLMEILSIPDGVMYDRNLSRNASSSRAIPVSRLIDDILMDTAMPIHWGRNKKGMQAEEGIWDEYIKNPFHNSFTHTTSRGSLLSPQQAWFLARDNAIAIARSFAEADYHKQIVNRLLEPFAHINVLITATEWDNFFELRDHADAQPEIQALARAIRREMANSHPVMLVAGEWHLPFVNDDEFAAFDIEVLKKVSVARCARTSYLTHEGKVPTVEQDLDLYERLVGSRPLHASPAEHQATPDEDDTPELHGNLVDWNQNRKFLEEAA
jgi:hypothetical protein